MRLQRLFFRCKRGHPPQEEKNLKNSSTFDPYNKYVSPFLLLIKDLDTMYLFQNPKFIDIIQDFVVSFVLIKIESRIQGFESEHEF